MPRSREAGDPENPESNPESNPALASCMAGLVAFGVSPASQKRPDLPRVSMRLFEPN